jgi:hypothetical protein
MDAQSSAVVPDCVCPVWQNEQIPALLPYIRNPEFIRLQHLLLTIRTHVRIYFRCACDSCVVELLVGGLFNEQEARRGGSEPQGSV